MVNIRIPLLFKYGLYLPTTMVAAPQLFTALRSLKKSQHYSIERINEIQRFRLAQLLSHAQEHVPRYRSVLSGRPVSAMRDLSTIKDLPFTTKHELRKNPAEFTSDVPGRLLTPKTTGGSTGEPLTIPKTRQAMSWELAAIWRCYSWAGVGIGDRQARFWGIPHDRGSRLRARVVDFISNRKRLAAFAFDERSLEQYDSELERFQPHYFYGYVSMLVEFADFYRRRGRRPGYDLRCIIATSEVLTESHRAVLQDVFTTTVFNEYGCGEVGTVAHECPEGGMHINSENLLVEILDGEREVAPGESGELVITELNNLAMPLIRYRTGDFATRSVQGCSCGRMLETVDAIHGRAYDMLHSKAGRTYHAEFMMYIFEDARRRGLGVGQFQVRQEGLEQFLVKIVPEEDYGPATENYISSRIQESFGGSTKVDFERVQQIPRERSGKMRVIVGLEEGRVLDR